MKRITITLWVPSEEQGSCFTRGRSFTAGSWAKAIAKARQELPMVLTTSANYHRDIARSGWATLTRHAGQSRDVYPEVVIAPSVGELGWAP